MAFNGCYFIFDRRSCHDFGLMIYDLSSYSQDEAVSFASTGSASEDRIASRYSSLFYGVTQNQPLTFRLVFGADDHFTDNEQPLTRPQVAEIANWLTGHNTMKWLSIDQDDLTLVRYKCYISDLKVITFGGYPWAFQCTVTCDSPFAYMREEIEEYSVNGVLDFDINNISSYKGYYKPSFEIVTSASGNVSIKNLTDSNREFLLTNVPAGRTITVDNLNQIITDKTSGANLYPNFNFNFFRLLPGGNDIRLSGKFSLKIMLAFPLDVGA